MSKGFKPSPQQKRVWTLRNAGTLGGHVVLRCSFPHSLTAGEVAARMVAEVDKHEILRTRLQRLPGYTEPLQFISPRGDWVCREMRPNKDVNVTSAGDRPADELLQVETRTQPDGTTFLKIRASSEMLDARSLLLLARYLFGAGVSAQDDKLLQYPDVSAWLRDMLVAQEAQEARRYWDTAQTSAIAARRRLSFDRAGAPTIGGPSVRRIVRLSESVADRTVSLARETGVSLEAVLLTTWLELLRRIGGGEGQSCAVAFDGANDDELAHVLGPLTRFLPLCAPEAACSVVKVLRSVQTALDGARAFQECYFVESEKDRGPYGFEFSVCPEPGWRIHELRSELEDWRMLLSVCEDSSGIQAAFATDPKAFAAPAVDIVIEQWIALLVGMTDPDQPLQHVTLASPTVSDRARKHGEGPRRERTGSLLDWIDAARQAYGARFVTCDSGNVALTDLDRRANALARDLVGRGVKPGQFVGIHIARSAHFLLAALAAVKAGAAYVPLDVTAPPQRLGGMLSQVPFAAIIADASEAIAAPIRDHPGLIQLGREPMEGKDRGPTVQIDPDSPVYVLFTSGSTGVPKPVVVPHRALFNHMAWMIETFSFAPSERFLWRTSTTFDASVWEMWAPMLVGADMVIAGRDEDHDIDRLLQRLQEGRIGVAQFVPSLLGLLVATGRLSECTDLRLLFCGGEALPPALLQSVQDASCAELVNLYGPTECCIDAAYWRPAKSDARETVAIGAPIDNMALYVLTPQRQLAGTGITGELYIGGPGLFTSYLGMDEKTTDALVSSPFGVGLLYRTGDQARLAEDGLFEFVGRLDDQVKLNGYRIELSEIDAALERIGSGARAATVVTADRQLVSFVVGTDLDFDQDDLRHALEAILPTYMIPSNIGQMEAFPLRANGKVDRQALAALASDHQWWDIHVPLEGEIEHKLGAIWSTVLSVDLVGATDSFFALGGDSIRSIQIVYEARTQGLEVSVREILRLRTIRAVALAIRDRLAASSAAPSTSLPEVSRLDLVPPDLRERVTDCYPASHMQAFVIAAYGADHARRGVFHAQQGFSVASSAFDPEALATAVRDVAFAYNFRTRFLETSAGLHQLLLPASAVEINLERTHGSIDARFGDIMASDRRRPFDPFDIDQSLLRLHVVSRSDGRDHRILISNHHAVQDGWGNVEFLNRLADQIGGTSVAAPVSNGCKELVAIESCEPRFDHGRAFGLLGEPDQVRRQIGPSLSESRMVPVPAPLAVAVLKTAEHLQLRPKSLILAAYCLSLAKAFGLADPVIGVVANGRDDKLSDPLRAMGLFWYLTPFRLRAARRVTLPEVPDLPMVEECLLKAEAAARAFWGAPGIDGSLLTRFTFNFVHFHNWSGELDEAGWHMNHRLDDFGADVGLAVGLAPEAETMLTLILDYNPDNVTEEQISALEQGLLRMLEELAQCPSPA